MLKPVLVCAVNDPDRLHTILKQSTCIKNMSVPLYTVTGKRNIPRALNNLVAQRRATGDITDEHMIFYVHEDVMIEGPYLDEVLCLTKDIKDDFMVGCAGAVFERETDQSTEYSKVYACLEDRGYISQNVGAGKLVAVETLDECFFGIPARHHITLDETPSGKHLFAAATARMQFIPCYVAGSTNGMIRHMSSGGWQIADPAFMLDTGWLFGQVGAFVTPCVKMIENGEGLAWPTTADRAPRHIPVRNQPPIDQSPPTKSSKSSNSFFERVKTRLLR